MPKTLPTAQLIALAAALASFALVLFAPAVFNDADTYWHIAAGRWMLDNQAVLRIDPFSYTFAGHPWQTQEWLAEIVMALAYIGLGWNGVALLFASAAALTMGLLGAASVALARRVSLIVVLILSFECVAVSLVARPHLLALPLLEMWTAGLLIAREEGRAPSWKLLPLMLLWTNLHASFLIGLLLIVPFALEAVLEQSLKRRHGAGACSSALALLALHDLAARSLRVDLPLQAHGDAEPRADRRMGADEFPKPRAAGAGHRRGRGALRLAVARRAGEAAARRRPSGRFSSSR